MGRIAVASIAIVWLIPISLLVNRIVPDPYMDEIFHIPQAQQYCRCNFRSWDPMITTPPGLYFLSLAYVASLFPGLLALQTVPSFSEECSTSILRFTNAILAVLCSILIFEIIKHLRPSLDDKKATFQTVVLSLYPLHWFFSFLYYTDVASLTVVLAMYLLTLKKKYLLSTFFGALSVLIRQTNIIWMIFTVYIGVVEFTQCHQKDTVEVADIGTAKHKGAFSVNSREISTLNHLRQRRFNTGVDNQNDSKPRKFLSMKHSSGLLDEIKDIIIISWNHPLEFLVSFGPFFMIFLAFVAFVYWNGSIVLGAKDAHTVSPHLMQMLYYSTVSTLFMFPVHFSLDQVSLLFRQFSQNKVLTLCQWFMALSVGFLTVQFFSIAHPYLLADNRHYTFYLWRKIINFHWSTKHLMVPLYVYSWFSIIKNLAKSQKKMWIVIYCLVCAATLIPAPLIEFRYYTIPFFFLILHTPINDNKTWLLISVLYLSINCFTMYMFLFRPFSWNHEAGIQRFIW